MTSLNPAFDESSARRPARPRTGRVGAPSTHVVRVVVGLLVAAIGAVGVVRTFDPVQLSATQAAFLALTVLGVAFSELHIRD